MRKIREVLRLSAAGMSRRDIAGSVGVGKTTVYEYVMRAEVAGLAWPLGEEMDDETLEARLFPPPSVELAASRPVPDWRHIHRELKRRHVTLRLLWLEWRQDHPEGWGYSQFCHRYGAWVGAQDVVMRLNYAGGERMFVDFSGEQASYVDAETGEVIAAEVFVAVLGASGMLYAQATRGQDLGSWLGAHVGAWKAYGGVAEVTVPDNLRSAVSKPCRYDPELNPSYAELAQHYRTAVVPARVLGTRLPSKPAFCPSSDGCWRR